MSTGKVENIRALYDGVNTTAPHAESSFTRLSPKKK